MKGFEYMFRMKDKVDCPPCFFCKYRSEPTYSPMCDGCIDNEDIALHKPNVETEFVNFKAISEIHEKALLLEQQGL